MGSVGPGFLGRLVSLFGARPRSGGSQKTHDGGLYVRVKCSACGEIVQARISPSSELSLADDGSGYFVRKVLVGKQCFRPIELEVHYADIRGKEISRQVRGGISVE
ncbi:MAG: hypothetical protein ACR2IK_17040 [Chloroflexota bacterium]